MRELIRCFVAVELPEQIKAALSQLQDSLRPEAGTAVRWVDVNGIHLTLKFLGNVPRATIPSIAAALSTAAQGVAPCSLELGGVGFFPNVHRPRVLWVGLTGQVERVGELAQRVERALAPLGFSPEERPFTPHLTLARLREEAPRQAGAKFAELALSQPVPSGLSFLIDHISLMRSQLTPAGAIYSRLNPFPLRGSKEV